MSIGFSSVTEPFLSYMVQSVWAIPKETCHALEFLKVLLKDPTSRFEVGLKAISESFFLKFARSHLLVKTGDGLLTPDFIT